MQVVCNACNGVGVEPGSNGADCAECRGTGFFRFSSAQARLLARHRRGTRPRNGSKLDSAAPADLKDSAPLS